MTPMLAGANGNHHLSFRFQEFYRLEMKNKELSLTGRNWGTVNFNAASLSFDIDKLTAFEVSLCPVLCTFHRR